MPFRSLLAALVAATALGASAGAFAMDDFVRASSSQPTLLKLCGDNGPADETVCKTRPFDAPAAKMEEALQAALAKAPVKVRPLLKRDQVWFNEMVAASAQYMTTDNPDYAEDLTTLPKERTNTLASIAHGFGRPGFAGRWVSAFGGITVTPADHGTYRLAIDLTSNYHAANTFRECQFTVELAPASDGWLKGTTPSSDPSDKVLVKMRRQGETLRLVIDTGTDNSQATCPNIDQVTSNYFASGAADKVAAADRADTSFVAPTMDCTRPDTATDEEICADPELAENDVRLNRAWKALLPRLDEATRRALTEDQHNWLKAQTLQYPENLHPAWEKGASIVHNTVDGRARLKTLQRERLALLEGFDEGRKGLAGVWLGYTALLKISVDGDNVKAEGWKWTQGDWKAGCEFKMTGNTKGGAFRSDEERVNPDTLERDHDSLIVNREDDAFARKRYDDKALDEGKCNRNYGFSSTTRLFPVRPSPDIDTAQKWIR